MKKTIASVAFMLMCGAAHAQTSQTFSAYVSGLSSASTPLSSSDVFYVNQSGNSRQITKNNLLTLGITGFAVDSSGNASPLSVTTPYTAGVWTSGVGPAANITRLDRVLVGTATQQNGAFGGTTSWVVDLINGGPGGNDGAQVSSISSLGEVGVQGAARTSDYGTLTGTPSLGTEGGYFVGYQDDTTHVGSIAEGLLVEGFRKVGAAGIQVAAEIDVQNYGTVQVLTPFTGIVNNATLALLLGSADRNTGTPTNGSAALYIIDNYAAFNKGIIFHSTAVDATVGSGGAGVAIEFADRQSIRWLKSDLTTLAEIWGSSTTSQGLNFSSGFHSPSFTVNSSGSVALGGASLVVPFQAKVASDVDFRMYASSTTAVLDATNDAQSTYISMAFFASSFLWQTQGSTALSIDASQNVIFGHQATPASAVTACTANTFVFDASYIYVCTASGAWKRVAIAGWP